MNITNVIFVVIYVGCSHVLSTVYKLIMKFCIQLFTIFNTYSQVILQKTLFSGIKQLNQISAHAASDLVQKFQEKFISAKLSKESY